jgi:hypothetical protein
LLSPAAANKAAKPSRKSGRGSQRSPSPLLVDGDWEDLTGTYPTAGAADAVARAAAGGASSKRKAAAAGSGMQPSPDPVRMAALQQRALQEQLAQATHAAEEDDDDAVELLDSDEGAAAAVPFVLTCWLGWSVSSLALNVSPGQSVVPCAELRPC